MASRDVTLHYFGADGDLSLKVALPPKKAAAPCRKLVALFHKKYLQKHPTCLLAASDLALENGGLAVDLDASLAETCPGTDPVELVVRAAAPAAAPPPPRPVVPSLTLPRPGEY